MMRPLILVLFFWGGLAGRGWAADTLTVDFAKVIQPNFLGVNAVYHGFSYLPESRAQGMTKECRQVELARLRTAGLHLARTFYRPEWAMGAGPWSVADWESEKMRALYAWLKDMQAQHIEVALNMGWWFGRDVIWNQDQHLPTYPDDMKEYVGWVSESLHQIVEVRGFTNVKYILMFTEPDGNYGNIPHGKPTWEYYKEVVTATHQRLLADRRRQLVKIVGPNTSLAPRWLAEAAAELNGAIDIYSSHDYNFERYDDWYGLAVKMRQAVQATGKPFWVDEYGIQDLAKRNSADYGNILAQANAAFMNAGAQTSLLWVLSDQYYPYPLQYLTNGDSFEDGKHRWGLWPWVPEGAGPRPAWSAFAMLSRLLGGAGGKVCQTTSPKEIPLAAVARADGNLSLLVVNGEPREREVRVELVNLPRQQRLWYRYLYDPAALTLNSESGLIGSDKKIVLERDSLPDRIPARGVAVYSTLLLKEKGKLPAAKGRKSTAGRREKNLAFKKKVVASSSDPRWPAENLTDGKRLTYWSSQPSRTPEFVEVDLGETAAVRQIDLYPRSEVGVGRADGFPGSFRIATSLDRKRWQTVVSRRGVRARAAGVQSFRWAGSESRYIRIWGEMPLPLGKGRLPAMQLGELKVYGD